MQQLLDTALARADPAVRDRFAVLGEPAPVTGGLPEARTRDDDATRAAEHRLVTDQNIGQALTRLDHLARWEPGTARREVAARLTQLDRRHLLDRADRRSHVGQSRIAQVLAAITRTRPTATACTGHALKGGPSRQRAYSSGLAWPPMPADERARPARVQAAADHGSEGAYPAQRGIHLSCPPGPALR
jgi:hypothetical protein